jgi:Glycosyl hydrolases family 32 N-terminal domain
MINGSRTPGSLTTAISIFFLKAPRALGSPEKRHVSATVGHATSRDLITWEYLGECFGLATASNGAFDDLAIWTGSVVRDHHQWRMFYTAISTAGHHIFDQRIGSVVADDLHHWKWVGADPVVLADSCWYKTLAAAPAATEGPDLEHSSETWRDPVVFEDPAGAGWYLLISARAVGAGQNDDGVIAHATSADLAAWELGPVVPAGCRLRPTGGVTEQDHRRSSGARLHLSSARDDCTVNRGIRRVLHWSLRLLACRTVGYPPGKALQR